MDTSQNTGEDEIDLDLAIKLLTEDNRKVDQEKRIKPIILVPKNGSVIEKSDILVQWASELGEGHTYLLAVRDLTNNYLIVPELKTIKKSYVNAAPVFAPGGAVIIAQNSKDAVLDTAVDVAKIVLPQPKDYISMILNQVLEEEKKAIPKMISYNRQIANNSHVICDYDFAINYIYNHYMVQGAWSTCQASTEAAGMYEDFSWKDLLDEFGEGLVESIGRDKTTITSEILSNKWRPKDLEKARAIMAGFIIGDNVFDELKDLYSGYKPINDWIKQIKFWNDCIAGYTSPNYKNTYNYKLINNIDNGRGAVTTR